MYLIYINHDKNSTKLQHIYMCGRILIHARICTFHKGKV